MDLNVFADRHFSSMELWVKWGQSINGWREAVRPPKLPTIVAATSKLKKFHALFIKLSRMSIKRTMSSLTNELVVNQQMTMRMIPLPWAFPRKLQTKSHRCPCAADQPVGTHPI